MRITRLVTYEGAQESVEAQLGASMPDGVRVVRKGDPSGPLTLTIVTLPSRWTLWRVWQIARRRHVVSAEAGS